jgi:hypothetical protein
VLGWNILRNRVVAELGLTQKAIFDPVGLAGLAYWYTVYPLHRIIFGGMLNAIGQQAEQLVER